MESCFAGKLATCHSTGWRLETLREELLIPEKRIVKCEEKKEKKKDEGMTNSTL